MKLLLIIILLCGSTWTPGYVVTQAAEKNLPAKEAEPACVQNEKEPAKAPFEIVPSVYIL